MHHAPCTTHYAPCHVPHATCHIPHATFHIPLQVVVFASDLLKAKQLIDSSVPELFIREHAGELYAIRMRSGGNEAWVTPLESNGLVQFLADEGLANITVCLCRQANQHESSPKLLVVCQKISPTAPVKGAPTATLPLLNCAASEEGKNQNTFNHWFMFLFMFLFLFLFLFFPHI